MSKKFVVDGQAFKTKKELTEYVQAIVAKYKDNVDLATDDLQFMVALIENHPQADTKIGTGIARIVVRRNPEYPATRSFHLFRTDGSDTDVSWRECLSPTPHHKKVIRAMRVLVEDQTRGYKENYIDSFDDPKCELTGESITFLNSHVDHVAPLTFDKLVEGFLSEYGLDLNTIPVRDDLADNKYVDLLDDDLIAIRWQEYHREHAKLRVISAFANLSIAKRKGAIHLRRLTCSTFSAWTL